MKKAILFSIALNGYDKLFKSCIETHSSYCSKHDIEYKLFTNPNWLSSPNLCAWLKIPLIVKYLEEGYEWVGFMDADCKIGKNVPDFRSLASNGKDIYVSKGVSNRINSGVLFVKNSSIALSLMQNVIDFADEAVEEEFLAPYENGHVIKFLSNHSVVKIVDYQVWNNTRKDAGEFGITHYAGLNKGKFYANNKENRFFNVFRFITQRYRKIVLLWKLRGFTSTKKELRLLMKYVK